MRTGARARRLHGCCLHGLGSRWQAANGLCVAVRSGSAGASWVETAWQGTESAAAGTEETAQDVEARCVPAFLREGAGMGARDSASGLATWDDAEESGNEGRVLREAALRASRRSAALPRSLRAAIHPVAAERTGSTRPRSGVALLARRTDDPLAGWPATTSTAHLASPTLAAAARRPGNAPCPAALGPARAPAAAIAADQFTGTVGATAAVGVDAATAAGPLARGTATASVPAPRPRAALQISRRDAGLAGAAAGGAGLSHRLR